MGITEKYFNDKIKPLSVKRSAKKKAGILITIAKAATAIPRNHADPAICLALFPVVPE
ncbi:hypothetical protein D3C86_2105900 [compost metagenome]